MVSTKGVLLTRNQALRLLDWHGGQSSAVYSLGSSSFSPRQQAVPVSVAKRALTELRDIDKRKLTTKDATNLSQRIKDVSNAIKRAG